MGRDVLTVPMPRRIALYAAALGRHRGLPRVLGGDAGLPDLSVCGETACEAARCVLLRVLGAKGVNVDSAAAGEFSVRGLALAEARTLWRSVQDECRAAGVTLPPPVLRPKNALHDGEVHQVALITIDMGRVVFGGASAAAYRAITAATPAWHRRGDQAWTEMGAHAVSFRRVRPVPQLEIAVEHLETLVLAVFEAWWAQRAAWHAGRVRVGRDVIVTAPPGAVRLDAVELAARLGGRERLGPNWRARICGALAFIASVECGITSKPDPAAHVLRLVDEVVDSRRLSRACEPSALARALLGSQVNLGSAFFVSVPRETLASVVPFSVTEDGHLSCSAGRAAPRGSNGSDRRARSRQTFFRHHPALEVVASRARWSAGTLRLARQLQQEARSPSRAAPSPRIGCNGKGGHGYRLETWMRKTGHLRPGVRLRSRTVKRFTDDLDRVREELGVVVEDAECGVELSDDAVLCRDQRLTMFLPPDWAESVAARAAESSQGARLRPRTLRDARQRARLTQFDVAVEMGVTQGAVSQWECGSRPVPAARVEAIAKLLGISMAHHRQAEHQQIVTTSGHDISDTSPALPGGDFVSHEADGLYGGECGVQVLTEDVQPGRPDPAVAGPARPTTLARQAKAAARPRSIETPTLASGGATR